MNKRLLLAAVAAVALATPANLFAHRMWMLPSGTVFSGTDAWVTVDTAVSNDLFYADHQPGRLENVRVWQPDGSVGRLQNGATGRYRSVFDVQLDKPGTWKIGSETSGFMGSFKVNGEEKRIGRRGPPRPGEAAPLTINDLPANATDVNVAETISRNFVFVTAGEPTKTVLKPSGRGLEMEPITHPDELVAGAPARFRFLIDGRPAPGLKVTLVPGGKRYRDAEGATEQVTGADGVLAYRWPTAGMYWLNATADDKRVSNPRATERRMSYAATLEVMAP